MAKEVKWLIWSNEHEGWWAQAENGYVEERELAGRYSFEDALRIVTGANEHLGYDRDIPNEAICPDW